MQLAVLLASASCLIQLIPLIQETVDRVTVLPVQGTRGLIIVSISLSVALLVGLTLWSRRPRSLLDESRKLAVAAAQCDVATVLAAIGKPEEDALELSSRKGEALFKEFLCPEFSQWKVEKSSAELGGPGGIALAYVTLVSSNGTRSELTLEAFSSPEGVKCSVSSLILAVWQLRHARDRGNPGEVHYSIARGAESDGPLLEQLGFKGRYQYASLASPKPGIVTWPTIASFYSKK